MTGTARLALRSLLLSGFVFGFVACGDSDPEPADGGGNDSGVSADAGPRDQGVVDSGQRDAQPGDTGGPVDLGDDAGQADTGQTDAGDVDLGTPDLGTPDGGPVDVGVDAGSPDGGPIGPSCNPTMGAGDACGGDPVGDWTYTTACVDPVVFATAQQACPLITVTQLSTTATGTLSLNADLSFTRTATATFIYEVIVPGVCAQPLNGCAGVAAYIENSIPSTRRIANCATQPNSNCNCSVLVEQVSNDSGTYAVDSANGIITANALEYYYCVSGDVLLYKGTTNNNLDRLISNVLER